MLRATEVSVAFAVGLALGPLPQIALAPAFASALTSWAWA